MTDDIVERLCREMHDRYEQAAAAEGWETQERSRVPWEDVPEANKRTMRAAIRPIADQIERLRRENDILRGVQKFLGDSLNK